MSRNLLLSTDYVNVIADWAHLRLGAIVVIAAHRDGFLQRRTGCPIAIKLRYFHDRTRTRPRIGACLENETISDRPGPQHSGAGKPRPFSNNAVCMGNVDRAWLAHARMGKLCSATGYMSPQLQSQKRVTPALCSLRNSP